MPDVAHMPCQGLVEVLTAYLEGTLPVADRLRLEAHLRICEPCVTYIEQFRSTIELAGNVHADDLPGATHDALLDAFRGWNAA